MRDVGPGAHPRSIWFDCDQRIAAPQRGSRSLGEVLINADAPGLPRERRFVEFPDHLCRISRDERTVRYGELCWYETIRRNQRVFPDDDAVHQDGVHADHGERLHGAAVEDRTVADVALRFESAVGAREGVQDTAVLDVRPGADRDAPEVTAQTREWADIAAVLDDDVTDEDGLGVHEGGRTDDRHDAVDLVTGNALCIQARRFGSRFRARRSPGLFPDQPGVRRCACWVGDHRPSASWAGIRYRSPIDRRPGVCRLGRRRFGVS